MIKLKFLWPPVGLAFHLTSPDRLGFEPEALSGQSGVRHVSRNERCSRGVSIVRDAADTQC